MPPWTSVALAGRAHHSSYINTNCQLADAAITEVGVLWRGRSHGVLAGPLAGSGLVLGAVTLVDVSNLGHQRIIWVGVSQQGADGEEDLGDGECGRPLVLKDIQADGAVRVDIGVVDSSCEVNLGRLEGVIGGEVDVQEVHTTGVGRVVRAHNGSLPVELILLIDGAGRAVGGRVLAQVDEFLLNSFKSHN